MFLESLFALYLKSGHKSDINTMEVKRELQKLSIMANVILSDHIFFIRIYLSLHSHWLVSPPEEVTSSITTEALSY